MKTYAGADFVTYKINEQFGSAGNNSSSYWRITFSIKIFFSQCQDPDTDYLKTQGLKSLPCEDTNTGMHSPHASSYPQSSKGRNGSLILSGLCSEPKHQQKLHLPCCYLWEDPTLLQKYLGNGEQARRETCLPTSNPDGWPFYSAKRSLRTCWKE